MVEKSFIPARVKEKWNGGRRLDREYQCPQKTHTCRRAPTEIEALLARSPLVTRDLKSRAPTSCLCLGGGGGGGSRFSTCVSVCDGAQWGNLCDNVDNQVLYFNFHTNRSGDVLAFWIVYKFIFGYC